MLKKKLIIIITILFTTVSIIYGAENPFPLPVSALSASYSGGSFSSMINPVFSDLDSAEQIAYRYISYKEGGRGNHFTSVNLFGLDIIYANYNTVPGTGDSGLLKSDADYFSFNKGFFFKNVFGFGAGYSTGSSKNRVFDNYHGWNAGLLLRPVPFISFGVVFRDINGRIGGEKIDPAGVYSASIRPWNEDLTLSVDCVKRKHKSADYSYSGEFRFLKDFSLAVKYGTDKSITAGLTIPLYIRNGGGVSIIPDYYQSFRSETSDLKSAGIALNYRKQRDPLYVSVSENYIHLKISDNYTSEKEQTAFFTAEEPSFQDLATGITKACDDRGINGIILEIDSSGFGMAQVQEIRDLLNRFRSNGKKVYAVLNYPGNREYYLATASDKIFFTPNSTFKLSGLSAKTYYLKGLLDRGGVKYESFSKGKYKSFSEMFTRNDMSGEARENMTAVLKELNEQFISGITDGRKISRTAVEDIFKKGFYTPAEAREKGFIDEIMYTGEAIDSINAKARKISFEDYIKEEESVTCWGTVPAIAVINVTGSIVSGDGGGSSFSGSTGDYDYKKYIEQVFGDQSVKAVVIRIDSGGGSAAASDFMWSALCAAEKKNPRPVVFSFGNMAASGGYYIACTGDTIFASRGTITGSIGVVAGKISAEELYSKIGISTETIKMSEFADIFSESRSLTQSEKELFQREIGFIYDRFTGKVIDGRKIEAGVIPEIAEGRIHTGAAARDKKLVDETGGIIAAIEFAKVKSGIDSGFRIINLPGEGSAFLRLISTRESSSFLKYINLITRNIEKFRLLDEQFLYLQPYSIEIR